MGGVAKVGRESQVVETGEENGQRTSFRCNETSLSFLPRLSSLALPAGGRPQVSLLPAPGEGAGPALEMDLQAFISGGIHHKLVNIMPPHRPPGTISRSPAQAGIRQARHLAPAWDAADTQSSGLSSLCVGSGLLH